MAARPYWSGHIRVSLVSFKVSLSSALKRSSQIPLHELDRKTGERIHHRNVTEDGKEVPRENIVKGYETDGDNYVMLEDEEINAIKLPSSDTLELVTFTDIANIPPLRYERPYFVNPDGKDAEEIYAVMHQALRDSGKAGLGQIAMRGREELCALLPSPNGLLLQTLRYNAELQDDGDNLPNTGNRKLKSDYLVLAKQLIDKNTSAPHFEKFHDHYHEALQELIKAKKAHRKPKYAAATKPAAKVVNFMDALRKSLGAKPAKSLAPKPHKPKKRAS